LQSPKKADGVPPLVNITTTEDSVPKDVQENIVDMLKIIHPEVS